MITLDVVIDNVYDDGTITNQYTAIEVPEPEVDEDLEDWASEELLSYTGTGRPEGEAGYFLKITGCDDRPDLVGRTFEWGI